MNQKAMSHQEESQSTPALLHMPTDSAMAGGSSTGGVSSIPGEATTSLGIIPENNLLESYTRLSISLEENGLFKVHERQTARMRTRSEWFLSPALQENRQQPTHLQHYYHHHYLMHQNNNHLHSPNYCNQHHLPFHSSQHQENPMMMSSMAVVPIDIDSDPTSIHVLRGSNSRSSSGNIVGAGLSASAESVKPGIVRRSSSRGGERRLVHRNSSRCRNKENGAKSRDVGNTGVMSSSSIEGICGISGMVSGKGSISATDIVGARDSLVGLDPSQGPGSGPGSGEIRSEIMVGGGGDESGRTSGNISERECADMDVQNFHVTHAYKPRI